MHMISERERDDDGHFHGFFLSCFGTVVAKAFAMVSLPLFLALCKAFSTHIYDCSKQKYSLETKKRRKMICLSAAAGAAF